MSAYGSSRKRKHEDTDPDVFPGSDEDIGDYGDGLSGSRDEKRSKRDRSGGGGLQTFTKYVCEKLESEREILNQDLADMLVREHTTGDPKKNDNIRRRVYDALSVINAIGLAEKNGKIYRWVGRPTLPPPKVPHFPGNLDVIARDKRSVLIRLIRRTVGLEYIRILNSTRNTSGGSLLSPTADMSSADELGEFQLPIVVLSTNASSKMVMETDVNNKETYIKINQTYKLKSSDSILTELGYDDFSKLDRSVANSLLQVFIAAHIPKDIIEEALNITISEADFRSLATAYADTNHIPAPQSVRGDTEPLSPSLSSTRGLDMIVSAVQQIESRSIRLPSITQSTQTDSS